MKILLTLLIALSLPTLASAQLNVVQGGTGRASFTNGDFIFANSDGFQRLTGTSSPFFNSVTWNNATGTSATTTNLFSTTASSTNLFSSLLTVGGTGLVVDSSREVGIGITAPQHKLSVKGQANTPWLGIERSTDTTVQFRIANAEGTAYTATTGTVSPIWTNVIDNNNSSLMFSSNSAGGTGGKIILDALSVGIGTTTPGTTGVGTALTGNVLHVASTNNVARLTVEGNTSAAIDLIDGGATANTRFFQALVDADTLTFRSLDDSGSVRSTTMTITGAGNVFLGDTANANSTKGLTINQGTSDDEIISLKSSDIAHSMTGVSEADTWFSASKLSATAGGTYLQAFTDGDTAAIQIRGHIGVNDPADTTAAILLSGAKYDAGTAGAALASAETVLQVRNYATALMTVLGSGSVGIGTTTPFAYGGFGPNLSLYGAAPSLILGDNGDSMNDFQIGVTGDDLHFLEAGVTTRMLIDQDGNVGIGTTTPWGKLSVTNTGSGPSFIVEDATSPDSTPFIVDASGNVGIGTAGPSGNFEVEASSQNSYFSSPSGATTGYSRVFVVNDASRGPTFYSYGSAFAGTSSFGPAYADLGIISGNNTGGLVVSTNGLYSLILGTNSAARLTIDGTGNVGIGITSPQTSLDIQTAGTSLAGLTAQLTVMNTGAQATDKGGALILGTGTNRYAGILGASTSGGQGAYLSLYTRPTSGNLTERVRIDESGNFGIGTTTPTSLLQLFSTATSTISIDSNSASKGGCIEIKDRSGTGYTYIYAEDGVLYSDTISCK